MKGSIDMTYRQPTTISLPRVIHAPLRAKRRYYPWVIAGVLLGHVAVFAAMTQLQTTIVLPEPAKPIAIRLVELAQLPPPPPPKPIPAPKVLPPPAPTKPKVVPVAPPPPVAKMPPPVMPTAAPAAKPIAKPVERTVEAVATPVAVVSTPVQQPTPVTPVVAPATPTAAPQPVPTTAPSSNPTPRAVAIDGVSYLTPPKIRFSPRSQKEYDEIGQLLLDISVDATGKVASVSVKQSSGNSRYDSAVSYAIKRTKFNPYRVDGVAQPFTVTAPFEKSPK